MHFYVAALLFVLVNVCAGADWNYAEQGKWKDVNANCGKNAQSPINIHDAQCDEALDGSISFTDYQNPGGSPFPVKNTGYTLHMTTSTTGAMLQLGTTKYKLEQVHFHWGADDSKGSEHTVNGEYYPAEMHLVHYNEKYSSLGEAVSKSDGLAVLGVFLKAGSENAEFKKFLDLQKFNVTHEGSTVNVPQFAMEGLIPGNTNEFYRYKGSLTTPPCDESVTWTVFKEVMSVSEAQLQEFRSMKNSKGEAIVDNYRAIQALNGRAITQWNEECSGAQSLVASLFIGLVSTFLAFIAV